MSQKITLFIDGMSCQACAARIEKVIQRQLGVLSVEVNFAQETACIEIQEQKVRVSNLIDCITKLGFSVRSTPIEDEAKINWRLILLWLCAVPFVIGMIGMLLGTHWMMPAVWQFVLASFVQWVLALPFYQRAWAAIKNQSANMDVLIVLGTLSTWIYSSVMFFYSAAIYFEASVMVLAVVSLGKYWESKVKKNSLNLIGSLLRLTPKRVEAEIDGYWQEIDWSSVTEGMLLKAKQGARVAADGVVVDGNAFCDESHLTGEWLPVEKSVGDQVLAGSLVSNGSVIFRSTALGENTRLGDMMRAVSDAQGSKAPIARFADKVSGIFVPGVLMIAVLIGLIVYVVTHDGSVAFLRAVSVLMIACPCALGLATPAAIMAGVGRALKSGILFRDAAVLEAAGSVSTVLLDKTGTLTSGHITLGDFWHQGDLSERVFLRVAAALESHVTHPLADAVLQYAHIQKVAVESACDIQVVVGKGVCGILDKQRVWVGSADFCHVNVPQDWQNQSLIAVRIGDDCAAWQIKEEVLPDSLAAMNMLRLMGLRRILLSGDVEKSVQQCAQQLDLDTFYSTLSPRDKLTHVYRLQQLGEKVAMVGDGVNDAAALVAADVGMAMAQGSDAAQMSAPVCLMQHNPVQIVQAIQIARATLRVIHQNLFFAFFYNILGIPLAAFGVLSPMWAGVAMAMSSVSVLLNALRLKRIRVFEG